MKKSTRAAKAQSRPLFLDEKGAPEAQRRHPIVSLDEVWGELVEEYGALKLIYNTLGRHHDAIIGEPVTKDMAEDLVAAFSELGHAMERLDALSDDVEELRTAMGKATQS